jgi:ADP-ribose pyrophosphatase YjhB (NUDIX family)
MENTSSTSNALANSRQLFELSKRIKAIAQTGLVYSEDEYNRDRYTELNDISDSLYQLLTGAELPVIKNFYLNGKEYPTPKIDIRAVIFNDKAELLMVKEKSDGRWSLPGGWADIGYTPAEVAVKEAAEETGFIVKPKKLLAVLDKKNYPHPAQPEYVYKHFIECEIVGGSITEAHDITEVAFFPQNNIPPLSEIRLVKEQVELMFQFLDDKDKPTVFE